MRSCSGTTGRIRNGTRCFRATRCSKLHRQQLTVFASTSPQILHNKSTCLPAGVPVGPVLKEWAVACEALGSGSQTILLRKGGIKEPTFKPQSEQFMLFATSFHSDATLIKPSYTEMFKEALSFDIKNSPMVRLKYFARITGAWTTTDDQVLTALDDLHVWTSEFLDLRLKWRRNQPLTILELRCYVLPQQLDIPFKDEYLGCFSWADVTDAVANCGDVLQGATPALPDAEFARRQDLLRQQLAVIQATPL